MKNKHQGPYKNQYKGRFTQGNYKETIHEVIDGLYKVVKEAPIAITIEKVRALTDTYVEETGKRPEVVALDRMATLILNEDITDRDRMKMRNNEHPIMSDEQEARRKEGRHQRKGTVDNSETSLAWAQEIGADGVDYRPQTRDTKRKMRCATKGNLRDKDVHARNKERQKKYRAFTKVQPVTTYFLPIKT